MARINVEDIWWSDPRRSRLIAKLGSEYLADGLMLSLWRISQDFHGEYFEWKSYFGLKEIEAVSSVGLATLKHHLVYVNGSKEHHDWLKSKREAARRGGLKSAQLRQAPLEQHPSKRQPSSSSSCSTSIKHNTSIGEIVLKTPEAALAKAAPIRQFVGAYVKAFQKRYGDKTRPDLRGKAQGQIKRFVSEVTIDRATAMIQIYLQMDDKWFLTKCHDFTTFLENHNKVALALDLGKQDPTKKDFSIKEILEREEYDGARI